MERLTKVISCPDGTKIYDISNKIFGLSTSRADKTRMILEKLAVCEDLEELIGIPLEELARIFRQHIPDGCQHPKKAIVLTDGDVDKWREYKAFEKDGRLLKLPRPGETEECRECVHTRASCHHIESKCSECPMTELFCDEFYVAIDRCYEDAYASGCLAGIEVGKYEASKNQNWKN